MVAFLGSLKGILANTIISQIPRDEVYYYHNDHLGTPQKMTNSIGTIVWEADYLPFGKANVDEDPDGDGFNVMNNIRFPGQYYDQETGLHYNWHRDYHPGIGRYIEVDPLNIGSLLAPIKDKTYNKVRTMLLFDALLKRPQVQNLFVYCFNNPINLFDSTGERGGWQDWGPREWKEEIKS